MLISLNPPADGYLALGPFLAILFVCAFFVNQAFANDETPERTRLAATLRQLDTIERLITEEAVQPHHEFSRYYFDYTRLAADLDRIRTGIHDYLSPSRAQPRDPAVLFGDYRQPTEPSTPEPEATP